MIISKGDRRHSLKDIEDRKPLKICIALACYLCSLLITLKGRHESNLVMDAAPGIIQLQHIAFFSKNGMFSPASCVMLWCDRKVSV